MPVHKLNLAAKKSKQVHRSDGLSLPIGSDLLLFILANQSLGRKNSSSTGISWSRSKAQISFPEIISEEKLHNYPDSI